MTRIFAFIVLALVLAACGGPPAPTPDVTATQAAMSRAIQATLTAMAPTATPPRTPTPTSTATPTAAEVDKAFLDGLLVGCKEASVREQAVRAEQAKNSNPCSTTEALQRAWVTLSACYDSLPVPSAPNLVLARQWIQTAGQKWTAVCTHAIWYCAGSESWDTAHALLVEAGLAGDKANTFLDLYFSQHPEHKPADWVR